MNDVDLDPTFSAGFRAALVDEVARSKKPRRRIWFGAAFVGILLATGAGGVATATLNTPPGAPVYEQVGETATRTLTESGDLDLGVPPAGANSISFDVVCRSAGSWSLEVYGGAACEPDELGQTRSGAVPLTLSQQSRLHVDLEPGTEIDVTAAYSTKIMTDLGVNASGQTYGASGWSESPEDEPDLIAARATNGRTGYILNTDQSIIDMTGGVTQAEIDDYIANTGRADRLIPVYESDGRTVIGEFLIVGLDTQEQIAQDMKDAGIAVEPAP
jgi:hypothetical protein